MLTVWFLIAALLAVVLGVPAVTAQAPGFSFSPNQRLIEPANPLNSLLLFTNSDTEPGIKIDSADNVYVGAIHGLPGGTVMWKAPAGSCTNFGCAFQFLGEVDSAQNPTGLAPGGGDEDHAIGSSGPGSPGTLVVASLWLGDITVVSSIDGGRTFFTNPLASPIPADDRQWVVADGPSTFYMTFHDAATSNIDVLRSQDGGMTWLPVGTAIDAATAPAALGVLPTATGNTAGEIQLDPINHIFYQVFAAPADALQNLTGSPANAVYMGVSADGGQTWTDHRVFAGPPAASFANIFPAAAVDAAGNVYAVWSDGRDVFLSASTDHGNTWSAPHQVSRNSAQLQTSIFPWIAAGQNGAVDLVWYGTSAASADDNAAQWRVFFAQSLNATSATPTFAQAVASDHIIHTGAICESGAGCTGNRDLADLFMVAVDSRGLAYIAYADDHQTDGSGIPLTQTYFTIQTGGPTIAPPAILPLPQPQTGGSIIAPPAIPPLPQPGGSIIPPLPLPPF
ncbi:MAG: exo-alpha-sialidase [Bacillati bacterium ANGP1]|uniref:Exo-alpha-sialidase n=1 Tax=Candidatus Segetimicrobium genomatis TaxID=2569760 RepID=A0A537K696_9BACT|nr:MAG: exo-alpha-sialidase [Terrabacteria group bacterium ANGP1]